MPGRRWLGAAFIACAEPKDRIGGAPRCQARNERNQADPAPRRFRADEDEGDQYQASYDPENPIETTNIPDHDEPFVEFMTG